MKSPLLNQLFPISSAERERNQHQRVAVGLSGGVDSSVAALILKHQGYQLIGLFMKNWESSDPSDPCPAEADYRDVQAVAQRLEIPYHALNYSQEYWQNVFAPSLADFKRGLTPNPDILCNREIKFKTFYQAARTLGADALATGHYCRRVDHPETGQAQLFKARDLNKDQTYFLYTITHDVLAHVLFPIGDLPKPQVRALATEAGLAVSTKKDSTGICFIGERDFTKFLSSYIPPVAGEFQRLNGEVVGRHQGFPFYTIGQRKGLGLGGAGAPWFVVGKDCEKNIVYVERGEDHPALCKQALVATDLSWVARHSPYQTLPFSCQAKIRYRQNDQACTITALNPQGDITVHFDQDQRGITTGQSIVFYQGDCCLGGGFIKAVL